MAFKEDLKSKEPEIEKLVLQIQDGDQESFAKIYDIFIDPIYRYVYYRVKSNYAEDIVETVFLKVWQGIHSYKKGKSSFIAWIFRIAHNTVIDHYRSTSDKDTEELDFSIPDTNRQHNPIKQTENVLDKNILRSALNTLKKNYRDVLIYKFINDLTNQEISEIMNKSEGSIRILQHRALKALEKELEERGINYNA